MTTAPRVQHKATIAVRGRDVEIHAPPFVAVTVLDEWLAETLRNPEVKLVSKTWESTK